MNRLILVFLLSCMPVMASNWVSVSRSNVFYDTESMQVLKSKDKPKIVFYWQKTINKDYTNNSEMAIDCKKREIYIGMTYVYDNSNNCIDIIKAEPNPTAYAIAPDTLGMYMYNTYCK